MRARRVVAAALCAILVGMVAHDCGVAFWRPWDEPGDVCDLSLYTFLAVWYLLRLLSPVDLNEKEKV